MTGVVPDPADAVPLRFDVDELTEWAFAVTEERDLTTAEVETMLGRVGRNSMPALLTNLYCEGLITDELLADHICAAWTSAEWPERFLDRRTWIEWFHAAGFRVDGQPADPPRAPVVLYRGAPEDYRRGMAWTARPAVARWFADRFPDDHARVWVASVQPWRILARCTDRDEDEWVIDPEGLEITEWHDARLPDAAR